ncbi:hypothetical protein [Streptomyces galbus]|uniref:Uncharacterized protein n=1 Tax=Streptomyces galbus TaxID=33898 RepID=A0ABX1IF24_STRGB|nr:hypothetical protein [Streptomyces galbus]NKQ24139.1 hypothetical protein [Streptomyces galbus]
MFAPEEIVADDRAQRFLVPFLQRTEHLLRRALRTVDPQAECQVLPAADLGIPYDVLRLAGGFATGCLVDWQCRTPVVPVDTTMNIDTSSAFWLDGDPTEAFTADTVEELRRRIVEESSYEWNFNRGNHFILTCRHSADGRYALLLHSNEKEFKNQFNGLCPTPGNWYEDEIRVFDGERRIRLLVGSKAVLFSELAHMLREFNILRHRFIATMLLQGRVGIVEEYHKHHYFMPTPTSAAIGCYLCVPGEEVPVFSAVGQPIAMFRPSAGGLNSVRLSTGEERLIVPHGWGMTASRPLHITQSASRLTVNGRSYDLEPGVSLLDHPDVTPRLFTGGVQDFLVSIENHTPGELVAELTQTASYSRHGFLRHEEAGAEDGADVPPLQQHAQSS